MWDLVDRIGVEMVAHDVGLDLPPVEIFKNFGEPYGIVVDRSDIEEFANVWNRIEQSKDDPRPFTDHDLDGVAAQAWLGDLRPNVYLFVNTFTYLMCNADLSEVSVLGFLWAWGRQRTSPWSDKRYWTSSGRGDGVVRGGTGRIADRLGEILGSKAKTAANVVRAERSGAGSLITFDTRTGTDQIECRQVVSALPAPIVLDVFSGLPKWKRAALSAVRYGQYVVAPIVVAAPGVDCPPPRAVPFRREIGTNWIYGRPYQMSPAPIDQNGGFFTSIATDADARRLWEDDDESIKSGVAHVFTGLYPKLARRILHMDVKRWEHGLPNSGWATSVNWRTCRNPLATWRFVVTTPIHSRTRTLRTGAAASGRRSARHDLTDDIACTRRCVRAMPGTRSCQQSRGLIGMGCLGVATRPSRQQRWQRCCPLHRRPRNDQRPRPRAIPHPASRRQHAC